MSSAPSGQSPQRTYRIFISSTQKDLVQYRAQVRDVLGRMGQFAIDMAQFGAQDGDATSVSLKEVDSADVFIGIIAWRYGYIPADETLSVTHMEYQEATDRHIPRFMFLAHANTDAPDDANALFPAHLRDDPTRPEYHASLLAFRDALEHERVVDYFTTPDDLAKKVATALHQYLIERHENQVPGLRSPRDLPPRAAGFVGREAEREKLCAAFRQPQDQALAAAIIGMGGVGKSALAAEIMHTLAADAKSYPGGIAWVRCDERKDLPGLVWIYDQLLAAWNIVPTTEELGHTTTPEAEAEARERLLRSRLRVPRPDGTLAPALVLLDNIENGIDLNRALNILGSLNIAVLLTSRTNPFVARLRVVSLEALEPDAAVRLFAQRYTDRGGAWNQTRDGPGAADVAEALGHLPLALELAAARATLKHISIAALAQELRAPAVLSRLKDPRDRSFSVRYSLGKSLDLLTAAQRMRFAVLGLPDGPDWPRPFIARLLDVIPLPDGEADPADDDLDLLAVLSLISLLAAEDPAASYQRLSLPLSSSLLALASPSSSAIEGPTSAAPAIPRVRLHPLLRELAREEWAAQTAAKEPTVLIALVEQVKSLIEEFQNNFAALAREEDLIAGALRGASRDKIALEHLCKAVDLLFEYLSVSGHWRLGMELLTLQRNAQRDLGDRAGEGATLNHLGILTTDLGRWEQATWIFEQALAIGREIQDRKCEGEALHWLGLLAHFQGDMQKSWQTLEQALELVRAVNDRKTEGEVLNDLGLVEVIRGNLVSAEDYFKRALVLEHEAQNWRAEGVTLTNLGRIIQDQGRQAEAVQYYQRALRLQRTIGARQGEASTLSFLGYVFQDQGQDEEAATYYQQALTIQRDIGDQRGEADTLTSLGNLRARQERGEEAETYFQQALTIQRRIGDRTSQGSTLTSLSLFAQSQGHIEDALRYAEEALALHREIGNPGMEGLTLVSLARLAGEQDHYEEAVQRYEEAIACYHKTSYHANEITLLNELAAFHSGRKHHEAALRCYERAINAARETGNTEQEGILMNNLAVWLANIGRREEALRWYQQALDLLRNVGNRAEEANTLHNMGIAAKALGHPEEAAQWYQQALAIQRDLGNRDAEAQMLSELGTLASDQQQWEQAIDWFQQAVPPYHETENRQGEGIAYRMLGAIAQNQERWEEAISNYQRAVPLLHQAREKNLEALALNNLGYSLLQVGQPEEAAGHLDASRVLWQELGEKSNLFVTFSNLFDAMKALNRKEDLAAYYQQALPVVHELGDKLNEAVIYVLQGDLAQEQERWTEAATAYAQALPLVQEFGSPAQISRLQEKLAKVEQQRA